MVQRPALIEYHMYRAIFQRPPILNLDYLSASGGVHRQQPPIRFSLINRARLHQTTSHQHVSPLPE